MSTIEKQAYDRNRYLKKKEDFIERDRKRRLLNPQDGKRRATNWAKNHPRALNIIQSRCQQMLKLEVLGKYSNDTFRCTNCNEDRLDCLTIDHINNDGQEHRKAIGSVNMYRWLRKNNYPNGFQVLCMNCQWVKKAENQRSRRASSKLLRRRLLIEDLINSRYTP